MKIYKLTELSDKELNGQYIFDLKADSGLSISYLRFKDLNEKKDLNPEDGFKGIAYVVKGELKVNTENDEFPISTGEAFELDGDKKLWATNTSTGESILIVTTGPSTKARLEELKEE